MSKRGTIAGLVIGVSGMVFAASGTASAAPPSCNWGQLTKRAIHELDFDQGGHASDPSGDGRGREDRVGLANVVARGDLEATCALIEDLLF